MEGEGQDRGVRAEKEVKKRKKSKRSCRGDVGNGGDDLGANRGKPRQERVGSVAANPDNEENSKEVDREVQGTRGL